jgi:hypothetical protein
MYHSVNITTVKRNYVATQGLSGNATINTYDDWHLVPSSRPTIVNPQLITNYIDIPGASGSVDMSEALTGFPIYSDREGDLEFYVLNDYGTWTTRRNIINNTLHGQRATLYLEDEPDFYYTGRLEVNDWKSQKDFSTITLHYRLEPYKYAVDDVGDGWRWDPFNFETGIIGEQYIDLVGDPDNANISKTYSYTGTLLPSQPTYGTWHISGATEESPLNIVFINQELNITKSYNLTSGRIELTELLFSNISGVNTVTVMVKGVTGKVTIHMHFRSL